MVIDFGCLTGIYASLQPSQQLRIELLGFARPSQNNNLARDSTPLVAYNGRSLGAIE